MKNCQANNQTKCVLLPEEDTCNNFSNFERLLKVPFIIYVNVKNILKPATDNKDGGPNTGNYQDHIVCSYGYKLVWVDE